MADMINVYPQIFARRFNPQWMQLDNAAVREAMVRGTGEYFHLARKSKAIIGLSGGLDSAVATQVAVEALGRKRVIVVSMPYSKGRPLQSQVDWLDAKAVADHLGIPEENFLTEDITPEVNAKARYRRADDKNRLGNIKARERMITLYDVSAEYNGLVVGTGNKSEIAVGYCTLFGDTACAVNPLGEIYKTQEFVLARHMGMLPRIVDRVPSAGLFPGQTDEGEMGFRYSELDPLAFLMYDQGLSPEEVLGFGFTKRFVARVRAMHDANVFKFRMPPIVALPHPKVRVRV